MDHARGCRHWYRHDAEADRKLFQEFSQASSATPSKYGGTGLGPAISRRFCQMMEVRSRLTASLVAVQFFTTAKDCGRSEGSGACRGRKSDRVELPLAAVHESALP